MLRDFFGAALGRTEDRLLQQEEQAADERAPITSIGSATRYRLMPHAFITMSSLFFVRTRDGHQRAEQHRERKHVVEPLGVE